MLNIYPSGNRYIIKSGINNNGNYDTTYYYALGKKDHMVIQQCLESGQVVYKVIINGEVEATVVNSNPLSFHSVKLYASDPWYTVSYCDDAAYVSLENLSVSTC